MKKKLAIIIIMISLFCGCGVLDIFEINEDIGQESLEEVPADTEEDVLPEETTDLAQNQEKLYIGEYLDYDNTEPNLEIAKRVDGKFTVQIGIFRLCYLDDGVGELTAGGMTFTATDPAGNAIGGIITVEDDVAKVTFTDSTWEYLENGTTYEYTKSSETPNIWGE